MRLDQEQLAGLGALLHSRPPQAADAESLSVTQSALVALLNDLPGMIFCSRNDRRQTMLYVSGGCRELTGYEPEDLLGGGRVAFADLIHPEDREPRWQALQQALDGRKPYALTYRIRTAAGEECLVWARGRGVYGAGGELLAVEGFVTDITERRRAEEALRHAEVQYRSIFDNSLHGIYQSTPEGRFLNVNVAFARMLGYDSPEEMIESFHSIDQDYYLDPSIRARLKETFESGGAVQGFECQARCRDGSVIWTRESFYAVRDASGALLYYEGAVEDITEHKLAEIALQESEARYRRLFADANDIIYTTDLDGNYTSINRAGEALTGYSRDEITRMNFRQLTAPEFVERVRGMLERKLRGEETTTCYETEIVSRSGARLNLEVSTQLIRTGEGQPCGIQGIARDVTARKRLESERQVLSEIIQGVNATSNLEELLALVHCSLGKILYAENCFVALVDRESGMLHMQFFVDEFDAPPPPQQIGRSRTAYVFRTSRPALMTGEVFSSLAGRGEVEPVGTPPAVWLGVPLKTPNETIGVLVVQHYRDRHAYSDHDIEFLASVGTQIAVAIERKRAEEALRESGERYRELFENANDVVYTHDLSGNFTSLNKTGERVTGYTREEACRINLAQVVVPEYVGLARKMIGQKQVGEESACYELEIFAKDGRRVPLEISTRLVYKDGAPVGVQGIARDITERKGAEEKLLHIAFHDSLTGLPNRALFTDHLKLSVAASKRTPASLFAVLFLDLDRFKVINDSLGHPVGDELLVSIARRLEHGLRAGDTVARLGGDEFAILLNNLDHPEDALRVAERVQEQLAEPLQIGGYEVFTTASIGIALSTTGYTNEEDVLRDADTVMYRAKSQGAARYEVFDQVMHARVCALLKLENDLRRAIERKEFCLYYQPIVALAAGRISGFEALVRWRHPERGLVLPSEFIPLAEETGLIVPLGMWVLEAACRQMQEWHALSPLHRGLKVSVNLSGRQFAQADLLERITRVLSETRFDPRCLQLELTESVVMDNAKAIVALMGDLRALGLELAIDDFGTGYSSLSYLQRFPIHTLKIDRSFISPHGDEDRDNAEIVRTIILLARNMGKDVVAEGVETEEQLARLRALGCDYAQGYLFSRPQDAEATETLLREGLRTGLFRDPARAMQIA
jgi:diguanylate cyclase (GGDEF)-like protein/PAS domain S-box-containing protein